MYSLLRNAYETILGWLRKASGNAWIAGITIVAAATIFTNSVLNNIAIVELAENHLSDIRIALLSEPRPQSERIAVVLISEDSLDQVNYRSPIDRELIAGLIDELERERGEVRKEMVRLLKELGIEP